VNYFPYIGITGFTQQNEVKAVIEGETLQCVPPDRKIMIGVLANSQTLIGMKQALPNLYPDAKVIPNIFFRHEQLFNVVCYHSDLTVAPAYYKELELITKSCGEPLNGIQLHNVWPHPNIIAIYRSVFPRIKIILRIGDKAFRAVDFSGKLSAKAVAKRIAERIIWYEDTIDAVLIDRSDGYGKQICIGLADACLRVFHNRIPHLHASVAGGFSSDDSAIEPFRALVKHFPDISIDTESGIRNAANRLDIGQVKMYIKKVSLAIRMPDYQPAA